MQHGLSLAIDRAATASLLEMNGLQSAQVLDVQRDFASAVLPVRCLMFIDKFAHDLNQRLDALA